MAQARQDDLHLSTPVLFFINFFQNPSGSPSYIGKMLDIVVLFVIRPAVKLMTCGC